MTDTDKIVPFPNLSTAEAEAAAWIARRDAGELTLQEQADFEAWIARSSQHRDALARLSTLWSDFDVFRKLASPPPLSAQLGRRSDASALRLNRSRRRLMAVAASVIALVAAGYAGRAFWNNEAEPSVSYETAIGSQRSIVLTDGSTILLNTDSRIDVDFTHARREIRLVHGEAYFEVAHNKQRPFLVIAGNGVVRDVGTAFAVRLLPQEVEVTVTKGDVELGTINHVGDDPATHAHMLGNIAAGQNAVFSDKVQNLALVSEAELNRKLAWRNGVLVYAGEPLSRVVADIGRYTSVKIEIADQRLNDLQVGGYFEVGKIDRIFEALEKNFGVHVRWLDGEHVQLSRL